MTARGGDAPIVGLRHVSDRDPGIRRLGRPPRQRYVDVDGRPVRDPDELARIRALAVPPAWSGVWISADPRGHLQAVGRDAKGRKQYRYHAAFARLRDADTYGRLLLFARRLPRVRVDGAAIVRARHRLTGSAVNRAAAPSRCTRRAPRRAA